MKKVPTTNNHEGYIPIFRRFLENELWTQKRKFSRAEAWIDLLFMARYKEEESTIIDRGEVIKVGYGEIITSIFTLSERWNRSRNWTYGLLKFLTKDGSILHIIKDKRRTTIKIVKLGYFRDLIKKKTTEKTSERHQKDIRKTSEKTYKNKDINKDKKGKNNNNAPANADIVENLLKEEEKAEKIRHPWQYLGLEIFEKTKAPKKKKAECIRLAKVYPQGQIMAALSFSSDYPRPELKWKMFLWKLHQFKKKDAKAK